MKDLLSSPMGMAIAVVAGLVVLLVMWKVNKLVIKVVSLLILAGIAAAVWFFRKGGF